jgi:nitrogen-specific signal transduction histidine kinase
MRNRGKARGSIRRRRLEIKVEERAKELKKLDELKSEFISTVSHELRTPLSIIKEAISLILDKVPGEINEKQEKILVISRYNIDRLARIIDNLLDISKIEAGKVELKQSLIDIGGIARQIAGSFEAKIREKGLKLRLDIDPVLGKVYADTDRMAQALTNLIGNAVRFTQEGYIEVSCKDRKDVVMCAVSDTGLGIARDNIPKIFDKFQQFGRVAGAGEKGTGLGLSIAKSIIDMHNGSISVESEEGKGSKFTFLLPKYTEQSLFKEYARKAITRAKKDKSKLSIIAVSAKAVSGPGTGIWSKKSRDFIVECRRLIKNTLHKEGDDVAGSDGEIIVLLSDCGKENARKIRSRIEAVLDKSLAGQKLEGKLKIYYGHSTYPEDAKDEMELLERARAVLTLPVNA